MILSPACITDAMFSCCSPLFPVCRFMPNPSSNGPRTEQLPVHAENHMYQDREGYMWYGTIDGLCRDDGYSVETFTSRSYPALANNYILHITEDTEGHLWLGTQNGVYLIDNGL